LQINVSAIDDKELNGTETYVFLVPESEFTNFEAYRRAYMNQYLDSDDEAAKKSLFNIFINGVLGITGQARSIIPNLFNNINKYKANADDIVLGNGIIP
jgi:aminoglycoside phosphotransferase family enzyme